tara:strand:- start:304 stop:570 length:267 start_codon:yes stop_codon:yes gene_type:complete
MDKKKFKKNSWAHLSVLKKSEILEFLEANYFFTAPTEANIELFKITKERRGLLKVRQNLKFDSKAFKETERLLEKNNYRYLDAVGGSN